MMKKFYLVLLISLLVVVSGCVQKQAKVDPNNGMKINEFRIDPRTAEYSDNVVFFLDTENAGGTTAKCTVAELFGVEGWNQVDRNFIIGSAPYWYGDTAAFSLGYSNGNIAVGIPGGSYNFPFLSGLPVTTAWNQFAEGVCDKARSISLLNPTVKVFGDMAPPDLEKKTPGQFQTAQWILRPPTLPEGLRVPYTVTARVSYLYYSTASVNIQAFNRAEYLRRANLGQQTTYPIDVVNTNGATIKVAITRGTSPIIVNPSDATIGMADEIANYLIEFQNVGDGWPLPVQRGTEDGLIFGALYISGPDVDVIDCLGQRAITAGTGIAVVPLNYQALAKLRSDKKAVLGCTIGLRKDRWVDRPMGTVTMTFDLYYGYYVDKTAAVDVKGKPGYHPSTGAGTGYTGYPI